MNAWTRYWFRPGPRVDAWTTLWILVAFEVVALASGMSLPVAENPRPFDPLPALSIVTFGLGRHLDAVGIQVLRWSVVALGLVVLGGRGVRWSLPLFTWGLWVLYGWRYSHDVVKHPEALVTIALVGFALAPPRGHGPPAMWPVLLVRWLLALAYLSAAATKLVQSGVGWADGETLQYFASLNGLVRDLPLGRWLGGQPALACALSVATLLFEATFWVVLVRPRAALVYVPVGVVFHAAVYLTLGPPFFEHVALYAAFVPWQALFSGAASRRLQRARSAGVA